MDAERATVVETAGWISKDYRLCIGLDGSWQTFTSKANGNIAAAVSKLKSLPPPPDNQLCPDNIVNPVVPPAAICPRVSQVVADKAGPVDYLVQYADGGSKAQRLVIDEKIIFDIRPPSRPGLTRIDDSDIDYELSRFDRRHSDYIGDDEYFGPLDGIAEGWSANLSRLAKAAFDTSYSDFAAARADTTLNRRQQLSGWTNITLSPVTQYTAIRTNSVRAVRTSTNSSPLTRSHQYWRHQMSRQLERFASSKAPIIESTFHNA